METIRCYDNGGRTADRYTVIFMERPDYRPHCFEALAMDDTPFHPQGFGQTTIARPGRHLGLRVSLESLPADCQQLVRLNR